MFKNLKLSMKMMLGFGTLILLALIIALSGLYNVGQILNNFHNNVKGNECLNSANKTGSLRRDFATYGFKKLEGKEKNAADLWAEACTDLEVKVDDLQKAKGLDKSYVEKLYETKKFIKEYKGIFGDQKEAENVSQEALGGWRVYGGDITKQIRKTVQDTITPAVAQATASGNFEEVVKWTKMSDAMDKKFVQEFFMLRVYALYLIAFQGDKEWNNYQKQLEKLNTGLDQLSVEFKGNSILEEILADLNTYVDAYEKSGLKYYEGILLKRKSAKEMLAKAKDVFVSISEIQGFIQQDTEKITTKSNLIMVIMSIFSLIVGILLAYIITNSIVKPIRKTIQNLTGGSEQVSAASGQVAQSSQQMAEGASEQASSLEEVSSSLEEMSSMTKQNADNAKQANNISSEAQEASEEGNRSMQKMVQAIEEIKNSSDETAKIIKTIDEIAFQTNLLALNAAVEAARAGEAGKGFAVVAEEVRNLAMRSADAAKNTSALIEGSQKNAENGVTVTNEVADMLTKITSSIQKVSGLVGEVSAASNEQAQGIEQINTAIAQMDQVTQSNAANAEESASASEELSSQAAELNDMIGGLEVIIEGATSVQRQGSIASQGGYQAQTQTIRRAPSYQTQAPARITPAKRAITTSSEKVVKPEEVIPLDDNELSDF